MHIHGGDVYGENAGLLDFSASLSPLGMPEEVRTAARRAVARCGQYPDPVCRELRQALALRENVDAENLFCSNGASDVLYRLALALRPGRALIPVPTFAEYAAAVELAGGEIVPFLLREERNFDLDDTFLQAIALDIDAVFLCTPNNPTGRCIAPELLERIVHRCCETGAALIVDESFLAFTEQLSAARFLLDSRLVVVRSLTKLYAMPGIRVGYCLSSDRALIQRLYHSGPPWPMSVTAQVCGVAAANDRETARKVREYVKEQRAELQAGLEALGLSVIPGQANFLLFRCDWSISLREALCRRGILIRCCGNFVGLDESWYRVAVRRREQNAWLLRALADIAKEERP